MEISSENLFILLENAINDGNREDLLEFLCNSGDEQYLDSVINKIGDSIKEILPTTLDSQSRITNILSIILGLAEIALFGPEKSEYLTRCLLSIAVDKSCSIYNLKHVLTMLKTFFTDEHIMEWSSNEESLFVPLKLLGVKLIEIGDYECQSILLETLWQISDADKKFWADMWFSNQKTRAMFLNLNADQFVLDCRKFLNCVNRNEVNQRTFAFVATSVSLGAIQLRKPYGSDFWIDFNYDTESISFFCSSLDFENEKTWETIFISADMVEGYCIQNKKSLKTKELCITLKFSCSQLLALEETSIAGLESQLIRMTFWSFLDVHHHIESIFKGIYSDTMSASGTSKQRKVSDGAEVVSFSSEKLPDSQNHKQRRASEPIELLCTSYPEETVPSSQHYKHRRASESTELVRSSYPQKLRTESPKRKRRRVSESTTLVPTADFQEEEMIGLQSCSNVMDNRKEQNLMYKQKFSEGNDLFLLKGQNKESLEINTPHKDLQKDNVPEVYADEDNVQDHAAPYQYSPERHRKSPSISLNIVEDHNLFSAQYNNISKNDKRRSIDPSGYKAQEKGKYIKSYKVHNSLQKEGEFEPVEEVNSKMENSLNRSSELKLNRIRNLDLLRVPNALRTSPQISVDGCLQSTPKRSQNVQLLAGFNVSKRKSSQVSVDGCLQSTPKRSQNVQLLAGPDMSKRNSPQLSPIVEKNKHFQPNVSREKTLNEVLLGEENRNYFEIEVETEDYQTHIDMECDTIIEPKKHKNILDKKNKRDISRGENSVGTIEAEENDNMLISVPQKKHRRAAVRARKRNKLILEQKGSETSFEGSQQTTRKNKENLLSQETEEYDVFELPSSKEKELLPHKRKYFESDKMEDKVLQNASKSVKRSKSTKAADANSGKIDHDEYAFCTPPPLVKRKSHKRSIFVTDTETGSSEVSWFSKFKLFDTPKQSYSNRKKINEAQHQKKYGKPKIRKTKKNLKTRQIPSQRNKASDSESRSKSAFSELERFSLVIENNKYKSFPTNNLSGLYNALDSDRHSRQSSIEDDDYQHNYPFEELDVDNEKEKSVELNGDSNLHVSENSALYTSLKKSEKIKYQKFPPSTSVEVSNITIEPNILSKNKKNIKSTKGSGKIKTNGLSKESKGKNRHSNPTMLKHYINENKNVENSLSNDLDSITLGENRYKKLKDSLGQESEKNVSNSIAESRNTSNKTPNILPNLPISIETLIEVSPFKRNEVITSGRWISPNKILENQYERSSLECKNTLTEESLSPYNDEKQGKKMHLNHFLESLSSVSTNPQKHGVKEVIDVSTSMKKSKTKPSIKKSDKKHSFQHSMSSENIVKDPITKQNQQSPEKHYTDLMQKEYNVASLSLQSNSLYDIEDEEHSEKEVSNNAPIESPLQAPSPMFRKTPSKMSGENHLPTKPSVLHILSDEVNNLTHKLFSTLKKCMSDFREKMVALRESIANTADNMISNESKFTEKDLQTLARNCRESRIHIQKHLKKLYYMGMEYFESEQRLERRLAKKHKKAVVKYTKSLQIAQSIAEKALEERFILKSRAFLKSFLKKMELV